MSRDLQPAVFNRVARKQALFSTVLITVWRLELSHVIAVMSQIRSYPEHVTFIFRHNQKHNCTLIRMQAYFITGLFLQDRSVRSAQNWIII